MKKKHFKTTKKELLVTITKIRELGSDELPLAVGGRMDCTLGTKTTLR